MFWLTNTILMLRLKRFADMILGVIDIVRDIIIHNSIEGVCVPKSGIKGRDK